MNPITEKIQADKLIEMALQEDITSEDVSTNAVMPEYKKGTVQLLCKQDGVICGLGVFLRTFELLDENTRAKFYVKDGDEVKKGQLLAELTGDIRVLLSGERVALNYLQRMSGIATYTREVANLLAGSKTKLLDTRKTTPGMRVLDKMAVKLGGGENHRMGLFDMILLKDNHIDFAGGIVPAIRGAKQYLRERDKNIPIECEVRTLEDIDLVFEAGGVDRIMFDNFSPEMTRKAVEKVAGRCETESSGGITLDTLRTYAETGVDFISVGALTHQIRSLDMSLKACE